MKNLSLIYKAFGSPLDRIVLEQGEMAPVAPALMRVAMTFAPINPSDLIPITGAYGHRIALPSVAGYEGVGRVTVAPPEFSSLVGHRVLPLRSGGTWQAFLDCDPSLAVPVPDKVDDLTAARAYINPLAALTMLDTWPVEGRNILLCGAGSTCADLLGCWGLARGAAAVSGIYRSESRADRLSQLGIRAISMHDHNAIRRAASEADLAFDALGGPIGSSVLKAMRHGTAFIAYGLLSGLSIQSFNQHAQYHRFHLRDALAGMSPEVWQERFQRIWPLLAEYSLQPVKVFPIRKWRDALKWTDEPGQTKAILSLDDLHDR